MLIVWWALYLFESNICCYKWLIFINYNVWSDSYVIHFQHLNNLTLNNLILYKYLFYCCLMNCEILPTGIHCILEVSIRLSVNQMSKYFVKQIIFNLRIIQLYRRTIFIYIYIHIQWMQICKVFCLYICLYFCFDCYNYLYKSNKTFKKLSKNWMAILIEIVFFRLTCLWNQTWKKCNSV